MSLFVSALLLTLLLAGCATTRLPHEFSEAIPASDSAFGRSIKAQAAQHGGGRGSACCLTAVKRSGRAPS